MRVSGLTSRAVARPLQARRPRTGLGARRTCVASAYAPARTLPLPLDLYAIIGANARTPSSAVEALARQRLSPPPGSEDFSEECIAAREEVLAACVQQLAFPGARAEYDEAAAAGTTTVDIPLPKLPGALMLLQARGLRHVIGQLQCTRLLCTSQLLI